MQILRRVLGLGGSTRAAADSAAQGSRLSLQLHAMLTHKELDGLAEASALLLRDEPGQADLACKAAARLARSGRIEEAQRLLADLLERMPQAISPRLVKHLLSSDTSGDALARLCKHALAGSLPMAATLTVIRHVRRQQIGEAADLARRVLDRSPDEIDLHIEMADILRKMNDRAGARNHLEAARRCAPDHPLVLRRLAQIEITAGNHAVAEAHAQAAVEAKPDNLDCLLDLARCLMHQKRFREAAGLLRDEASRRSTSSAKLHALLGHVARWSGAHAEAVTNLNRAIELDPDCATAMVDLAQVLEEIGDFERALDLRQKALATRLAQGDVGFKATNLCHLLLACGRSREAWAANLDRTENQALRTLPGVRLWRGESLDGKSIIVINEGGPGDQIRDACCYPDVIEAAAKVSIACEPRLRALFERSFPCARFLSVRHEQRVAEYERPLSKIIDDQTLVEIKQHDYCLISPDLLYYFRGDDRLWGHARTYLVPAPDLIERWHARVDALGPGFRVGISWRSGSLNYNRECFYTQLLDWGPILRLPGVRFVNVQYDDCEQELRSAEEAFGIRIHRWEDLNLRDDFDSVSALLKQLDLVLAPNNTVLELAGALGVHGGYMIRVPIAYDYWRRKDDTWQDRLYPSVRHIRGNGSWDSASLVTATASYVRKQMEGHRRRAD